MSAEYKQVISGNSGTLNKSKLSSASALKRICGDQMRLQPLVRADLVQLALICPGLRVYDFLGECVSDRGGVGGVGGLFQDLLQKLFSRRHSKSSPTTHTHTHKRRVRRQKKKQQQHNTFDYHCLSGKVCLHTTTILTGPSLCAIFTHFFFFFFPAVVYLTNAIFIWRQKKKS